MAGGGGMGGGGAGELLALATPLLIPPSPTPELIFGDEEGEESDSVYATGNQPVF